MNYQLSSEYGGSASASTVLLVIGIHLGALAWLSMPSPPTPVVTAPQPLMINLFTPATPKPKAIAPLPIPKPKPIKRQAKKPEAPRHKSITPPPEPLSLIEPPMRDIPQPVAPVQAQVVPPAPVIPPNFNAAYLQNPAPEYPRLARRLGEQGTVLLRVQVKPDGRASHVAIKASSGSSRLDASALDAVKRWRFVPAKQGDAAVSAWVIVPIIFTLES